MPVGDLQDLSGALAMMTQGALVLPVVTRGHNGAVSDTKLIMPWDLERAVHHRIASVSILAEHVEGEPVKGVQAGNLLKAENRTEGKVQGKGASKVAEPFRSTESWRDRNHK